MARRFIWWTTACVTILLPLGTFAQSTPARDWLTWGYDQERTGWNKGESTLSKDNVGNLELKWSAQLSTQPKEVVLSTETAPIVVEGVNTSQGTKNLVFIVGSDDTVFAIDADTGKILWQKTFPNSMSPKQAATWLCSDTQNATPVIDKQKGIIYLNTSDGKLRGLSLSDGEDRIPPTDFVIPFARNWSLNLIDDVVYSPTARGCGGAAANLTAMDVSDPSHLHMSRFYTSGGRPSGAWGRGGVVRGPKGVYEQTADAPADPAAGIYGETVLAFAPKELRIVDSFTPSNWRYLNAKDLDMGAAGPVIFPYKNKTLLATAAKEAVLYLLDANALGGGVGEHSTPLYQSPRLGNDEVLLGGRGVWGGMATYQNPQGDRFLYMPMWGPPSKEGPQFKYHYDDAPHGSVMGLKINGDADKPTVSAEWISRDMQVPDVPVVANGVVYAIQTGEQTVQNPATGDSMDARPAGGGRGGRGAGGGRGGNPMSIAEAMARSAKFRATPVNHQILYAFDAETGKQLYSSGTILKSWVHFSEPVVALGKVFVVSWDAHVYAFGLK